MKQVFEYKKVESASVQAMAETFTPEELKAMIAYYSNPASASAASKMDGYQKKLAEAVHQELDAAITKIKYPKKP